MKRYSIPYILWSFFFILLPLVLIAVFSFNGLRTMDLSSFSFSLEHYSRFFEPLYLNILGRSIWLSVISTIACLLVGYPCAYFISKMEERKGSFMILLFVVPMWMNFLLRTYAWLTLLGRNGIFNKIFVFLGFEAQDMLYSTGAILMGMIYNFLPFMVLPIYSVLLKMDHSLVEAAGDLGADERTIFFRVTLPLSFPGIRSGVLLVFIPALSTFVISALLGGNKYYLIGNLIEQQFRLTGNWGFGSAASVILMVILFLLLGIFQLISKKFPGLKRGRGRV